MGYRHHSINIINLFLAIKLRQTAEAMEKVISQNVYISEGIRKLTVIANNVKLLTIKKAAPIRTAFIFTSKSIGTKKYAK